MAKQNRPTPNASANSDDAAARKARKAKRAAQKRRATAKARKDPQAAALLDVAAERRRKAEEQRNLEDALIGTINWQWRKFALGLMNGLNNYKAYAEAYDMNDVERDERQYQVACVLSSQLLRNPKFRAFWQDLIVEQGFSNEVADTEMVKLITDADTPAAVRRATIHDYNELQGRIIKKASLVDDEGKSLFDADSFKIEVVPSAAITDTATNN